MSTPSKQMLDALEHSLDESDGDNPSPTFPKPFLIALRLAIDAGLTCEQITALIMLQTGVVEMEDRLYGENLVDRIKSILRILDITR